MRVGNLVSPVNTKDLGRGEANESDQGVKIVCDMWSNILNSAA